MSATPPPAWNQPPQQPQRGWFGRNWWWFLPGGCLFIVLGIALLAGGIGLFAFRAVKDSEPVQYAVQRAKGDPRVVQVLGEPVEQGALTDGFSGKVDVQNGTETCDLTVPVRGPKGKGTVHVVGTRTGGAWNFTTAKFTSGGETIDLNSKGGGEEP